MGILTAIHTISDQVKMVFPDAARSLGRRDREHQGMLLHVVSSDPQYSTDLDRVFDPFMFHRLVIFI